MRINLTFQRHGRMFSEPAEPAHLGHRFIADLQWRSDEGFPTVILQTGSHPGGDALQFRTNDIPQLISFLQAIEFIGDQPPEWFHNQGWDGRVMSPPGFYEDEDGTTGPLEPWEPRFPSDDLDNLPPDELKVMEEAAEALERMGYPTEPGTVVNLDAGAEPDPEDDPADQLQEEGGGHGEG